jgi:hypothetical protein
MAFFSDLCDRIRFVYTPKHARSLNPNEGGGGNICRICIIFNYISINFNRRKIPSLQSKGLHVIAD